MEPRHVAKLGGLVGALVLAVAAPASADLRLGVIDPNPSPSDAELDASTGGAVRVWMPWCEVQDPWDRNEDPQSEDFGQSELSPDCGWEDHEIEGGNLARCWERPDWIGWNGWDWDEIDSRLFNLWQEEVEAEHVVLTDAPQCAGRATCEFHGGGGEQDDCSPAESNIDRWRAFVVEAARRYGPDGTFWNDETRFGPGGAGSQYDIVNWDVWNEPDSGQKWNGNASVAQYAEVLHKADAALHQVADPDLILSVAGNVTYGELGGSGYEFLTDLYKAEANGGHGARLFSDRAAFHPFRSASADAIENKAKQVAGIANIEPLAITAMGWSVNDPAPIAKCVPSEGEQARMLAESFDRLVNQVSQVRWVIWFNSIDQERELEAEGDTVPPVYYPPNDVPCEADNSGGSDDRRRRFGLWAWRLNDSYRPKPALCEFERRTPSISAGRGGRNAMLCPLTSPIQP